MIVYREKATRVSAFVSYAPSQSRARSIPRERKQQTRDRETGTLMAGSPDILTEPSHPTVAGNQGPPQESPPREPGRRGTFAVITASINQICSAWEWLFGVSTLIVGLAVLAAIPVLQFLSLGYMLETSGRIVPTGRLRDGFVGVRRAARV